MFFIKPTRDGADHEPRSHIRYAGINPCAGTPLTTQTLLEQAEMIRIVDAIDAAVDAKDWPLARAFLADTLDVDFTSLAGGSPATIPADG